MLFDNVHSALEATMRGADMRGKVLQANLANVNTPGYRRRDVDFQGVLAAELNRAQQTASPVVQPRFAASVDASAGAVRPDGNTVDVDSEGAQIAENALLYTAASQLLTVRRQTLETVMRTSN